MTTAGRKRLLLWGGVGVALAIGLTAALMPRATLVDLAEATRGPLAVTLDHEGRTRVRERYVVSAPVAGRVLRIELEPGDRVTAGETVLARFRSGASSLLDARTRLGAEARVRAAEAGLARARAERDRARTESGLAATERDRAHQLEAVGLATVQARQSADAEATARLEALAAAESAAQAAAGELDAARAALVEPGRRAGSRPAAGATLSLRSPIDGVVLKRLRESEADVPQGEPLLEVADLATLEVMADFLSADAIRIKAGMPVLVEQWGGGAALNARVRRVEPAGFLKLSALGVEEQRVWVIMEFVDPRAAWKSLGDGYRVETRVVVWDRAEVTSVPTASLFRNADGWAAFVASGGRAALRTVRVGQRNDLAAEILSGVSPGERVVVHPPDDLKNGAKIGVRN